MLVHASGEWIASDWPVCPISDLASPRRMGAALTYARRYALFTLVGIAGEDALDAPDLNDQAGRERPSPANGAGNGFSVDSSERAAPLNKSHPVRPGNGYEGRAGRGSRAAAPKSSVMTPSQSAELRDRLLTEVAEIRSGEQAEGWARMALPSKNDLTAADAKAVEAAFELRWSEIAADNGISEAGRGEVVGVESDCQEPSPYPSLAVIPAPNLDVVATPPPPGIDKSVLALPEPKRHRNKEHLRFVAQQPCLVCGRTPSDPHHLRFAQARALGRKVSDEFVVPLCRSHHRALHRVGNEPGWWQGAGIDPLVVARQLWGQSRLIEQVEPATTLAPSEPSSSPADPRPGSAPPLAAAPPVCRRGRPRKQPGLNEIRAQTPADGRLPP
jgi:hypothetical protein